MSNASDGNSVWTANAMVRRGTLSGSAETLLGQEHVDGVARFHRSLADYRPSPLVSLSALARRLKLGAILVKDESSRFSLPAFKVLGGSYAAARLIERELGISPAAIRERLSGRGSRDRTGLTLATATDGNHGRGVAWAASRLGCDCEVYVHKDTSRSRIAGIEAEGANVTLIDGNYDRAVRQLAIDAEARGWQVVSDTSWPGYEDVPAWVMQGYSTIFSEAEAQRADLGFAPPTHLLLQAGVGSFAAAGVGYHNVLNGGDGPVALIVEPEKADCLRVSVEHADGRPHGVGGDLATIMAGLSCGEPNPMAWEILRDCGDYFMACGDHVAALGMRAYACPLAGDQPLAAGESAAVTLGALIQLCTQEEAGRRQMLGLDENSVVLLVITEGITDPEVYWRVVWGGDNPLPTRQAAAIGALLGAGE